MNQAPPMGNGLPEVKSNPQENSFEISLPNGMSLVAYPWREPAYPGIRIGLKQPDGTEEQICFAEYNSGNPDGKNICICAYAHNIDDPAYYARYHDDGIPIDG